MSQCIKRKQNFIYRMILNGNNIRLIFRVKIQKVLPADTVAVYKCDFGDMNLLSVDLLKPLGPEFRKIPQLAIPANLHGTY